MASADTRNLIQSIEATSATIAADKVTQEATNATNAAAIAAAKAAADMANSGVAAVNTIATEITEKMVINEVFSIAQNIFNMQDSGLYHAVMNLVQVDGAKGVQLSLTDADGDYQGFSQLIHPYMGDAQKAAVELTANQLMDNSYPLSFLCQGRKLSQVAGNSSNQTVGTNFKKLGNRNQYYRLTNGNLDQSTDGVNVENAMVFLNVTSGYMLTTPGTVSVAINDGTYYRFDGSNPLLPATEITQITYDSAIGFPDRVAL